MNFETKKEAKAAGKKLLKKMKGKGWKLRVWENMGWHYCVHNGGLSVYPCRSKGMTKFHAMLSEDCFSDLGIWSFGFYASVDPNKAVQNKIKDARKVVNELNSVVVTAEGI